MEIGKGVMGRWFGGLSTLREPPNSFPPFPTSCENSGLFLVEDE
jgi:hypothetical protein